MKSINPDKLYIINRYDPIIGNRYNVEIGRRIILNKWEDKVVSKGFKSSDDAAIEKIGLEAKDRASTLLKKQNYLPL